MKEEIVKTIKCAIYTRKSTDEGLEKEFNTLEAQREAGLNYVKSQVHQGWEALAEHYDDGGYSGGKAGGTGTCYDEYGRAIYRGHFSAGSPVDVYPGNGNYSDYRFEWKAQQGGYYFGETYKGVPNGLGIFFADDGSAWMGFTQNGVRGRGIDLPYANGRVSRSE